MPSPTQRSLQKLRNEGYEPAIVEHWNPFAKIRQDLWNCLDLIAVNGSGILGVQTTSGAHVAHRVAKLRANPLVPVIMASGIRIEIHGWRKLRSRGKKPKERWECRVVALTPEMLNPRDPNPLHMFETNQAPADSVVQGS